MGTLCAMPVSNISGSPHKNSSDKGHNAGQLANRLVDRMATTAEWYSTNVFRLAEAILVQKFGRPPEGEAVAKFGKLNCKWVVSGVSWQTQPFRVRARPTRHA